MVVFDPCDYTVGLDRYVTSHYLKKPERFEWHLKKLLHKIMLSNLARFDPDWDDGMGMYYDFSEEDKAEPLRDDNMQRI